MARSKYKTMPAKGLTILTWAQVETLDRLIAEVCKTGKGEVTISIERGLPRRFSLRRELAVEPSA